MAVRDFEGRLGVGSWEYFLVISLPIPKKITKYKTFISYLVIRAYLWHMVIISKSALAKYGTANAQAAEVLAAWYQIVRLADWSSFNELRVDFPSADYIGNDRFIFNIKGNRYRLLALIFFDIRTLYIHGIYTHAEYTKLIPRLPTL